MPIVGSPMLFSVVALVDFLWLHCSGVSTCEMEFHFGTSVESSSCAGIIYQVKL